MQDKQKIASDYAKTADQCKAAGLAEPLAKWAEDQDIIGRFISYRGEVFLIMSKTMAGYYGDGGFFAAEDRQDLKRRADKWGFVHCLGLAFSRAYDPEQDEHYTIKEKPPKPKRFEQLRLF